MEDITCGYEKRIKEKARKRSKSAMKKSKALGTACNIFTAYVYWDPTYRKLDGAMHLPGGMEIPDVTKFLKDLRNGSERLTRQCRKGTKGKRRMPKNIIPEIQDEITVKLDSINSGFDAETAYQQSPSVSSQLQETCGAVREASCDQSNAVEAENGKNGTSQELTNDTPHDDLSMDFGTKIDQNCLMDGDIQLDDNGPPGDSSRAQHLDSYGPPNISKSKSVMSLANILNYNE